MQDALERLDGVHHIRIDLQTNLVTITPEKREELALEEVPRAVKRAGFVPAQMHLQARGSYLTAGNGVSFRIRGWKRALNVRGVASSVAGEIVLQAVVDYTGVEVVLEPLRPPLQASQPVPASSR